VIAPPQIIETWAGLPRAVDSHLQERLWFDVKETLDPKAIAEMGKDVAAFANGEGGALIIGATEGPTEPDYSCGLPASHASKLEHSFDLAVRDFCRPSPTVHARTIPLPGSSSSVVLVINVEPLIDGPAAARHETDRDMWRFPRRVGRHTEFLLPEQLPYLMNSKIRRARLLLLRAVAAGGEVDLFTVPGGSWHHSTIQGPGRFSIVAVDKDDGGSLSLRDVTGELGGEVALPLEDVEAVWLHAAGQWAVRVAGRLERLIRFDRDDAGAQEVMYTPPGTFVVAPLGKAIDELSSRVKAIADQLGGTLDVHTHERREPSDAEIAELAHRLWQVRLRHEAPGTATDDWLRARQHLLRETRGK